MKQTTKRIRPAFEPTAKVRVVPKNRRMVMAPESREPRNIKVRTNIHLDLDVINFFKARAEKRGALPYQTQINAELRKIIEGRYSEDVNVEKLARNEKLIQALAERLRGVLA